MKAVNVSESATLFVKSSGTKAAVAEQVGVLKALAQKYDNDSFKSSDDREKISNFWSARKTALWSLIAQKRHPDDKFLSWDVAVPISRLADIIEESNWSARIEPRTCWRW